jgi:ParB family transcriptional regulator, chromosome partitioning protein
MKQSHEKNAAAPSPLAPKGVHVDLTTKQLKPNPNNPRRLFDAEPLERLKESIREHGILVPLTVYKLTAQDKYAILDGERRYRCCLKLEAEGLPVSIPANVVEPPDKVHSLIYMFNIHAFREQWELMPTALSLKQLITALGHIDITRLQKNFDELHELTGLSYPQLERCRRILTFPERFQKLSLDADPAERIPSNFWIEVYPVLELAQEHVPEVIQDLGRDGITDRILKKYRTGRVKNIIHLRRISEAFDVAEEPQELQSVGQKLREYLLDPELETREAFDGLIRDNRRFQTVLTAADRFLKDVTKARVDHSLEGKNDLIMKLTEVLTFVQNMLEKLSGGDEPPAEDKANYTH